MDQRKQQTYSFSTDETGATEASSSSDRAYDVLRLLSILLQGFGLTSTINGALNLYLTTPYIDWPMASGSNVWAGLMTFITGVVGYAGHRTFPIAESSYGSKMTTVFYCLLIISTTTGALQSTYSTYGFVSCGLKLSIPCDEGKKAVQIMTTEALSVCFGILIITLSISAIIFINYNKTLKVRLNLSGKRHNAHLLGDRQ